jgi:hypothetical protein
MLNSQQVIFSRMSHSLDTNLDDEMHDGAFCNNYCFNKFFNFNKFTIISNKETLSIKIINLKRDFISLDIPNKFGFNKINKFLINSLK